MELIKVTENAVNARDLHEFLEIKHPFRHWIRNIIRDYKFKEGRDFRNFYSESNGGRPKKEYAVTIDMAKNLCMVCKTENGRKAREYFIKCEEIAKKALAGRLAGIEIRKTLTDKIKESGENERMHGHGYSTYTRLAYKICGIEYSKESAFRDKLTPDQIDRVKLAESMIGNMIELGKEYADIKDCLGPLFDSSNS